MSRDYTPRTKKGMPPKKEKPKKWSRNRYNKPLKMELMMNMNGI